MKKDRLLNPAVTAAVASLGHTEYFCIADCGLPIPKGTETIDLSLTAGIPAFLDVLHCVNSELVIESFIVASEMEEKNESLFIELKKELDGLPYRVVPHKEFKKLVSHVKCVIRTGEVKSYANVILIGGVNF